MRAALLFWLAVGNLGRWLAEAADRHANERHLLDWIRDTYEPLRTRKERPTCGTR